MAKQLKSFAKVPMDVLRFLMASKVTTDELAVIVGIYSFHSDESPKPWAGAGTLAQNINRPTNRVWDAIYALEDDGILTFGKHKGDNGNSSNQYNLPALEKLAAENPDGIKRKPKESRRSKVGKEKGQEWLGDKAAKTPHRFAAPNHEASNEPGLDLQGGDYEPTDEEMEAVLAPTSSVFRTKSSNDLWRAVNGAPLTAAECRQKLKLTEEEFSELLSVAVGRGRVQSFEVEGYLCVASSTFNPEGSRDDAETLRSLGERLAPKRNVDTSRAIQAERQAISADPNYRSRVMRGVYDRMEYAIKPHVKDEAVFDTYAHVRVTTGQGHEECCAETNRILTHHFRQSQAA